MKSKTSFFQKPLIGIKIGELIFFIGFYLFWAFAYHVAITVNSRKWNNGESSILILWSLWILLE